LSRSPYVWIAGLPLAVAVLVALLVAKDRRAGELRADAADLAGEAMVAAAGPRLISNQTDYPVTIYGQGFHEGMTATVAGLRLPTHLVDARRLTTVIPGGGIEISAAQAILQVDLRLEGARGQATLTLVNDAAFVTPVDLEVAQGRIFVASRTTDELLAIDEAGAITSVATCDGPRSLDLYRDGEEQEWLVVACEFGKELRLVRVDDPSVQRSIAVAPSLQAVRVAGGTAWVTEHRDESVIAVDLETGEVVGRFASRVDPRPLDVLGDRILVGNGSTEDLTLIRLAAKGAERDPTARVDQAVARPDPVRRRIEGTTQRVAIDPQTRIIGGHTEDFARYVMGGKRVRAIAASDRLGVFFVSSLGPNVGPNPERMEVTMNGGIGVVDTEGNFLRHVSLRRGLPEGLALDEARGLLYVADGSTGRIEILDATRLAESDEAARGAFVAELEIPPSEDTPRLREPQDFGVEGRSTDSLHSGPLALRLSADGEKLWVLARFAGAVQAVDVSVRGKPLLVERHQLERFVDQPARRLGEIAYYTDLGNSRMSCDGCHPDGHTGGVLFTKGQPMRIYRSPTMRAVRDSAPYFTPSMLPTLKHMARDVLGRNRFYNPRPERKEIAALAHYTETITPLPNPYFGEGGELPRELRLPGGGSGDPVAGLAVFDRIGCESCHPAPQFTTDQDEETRGQLHRGGSPLAIPLRPEMQDMHLDPGWPSVSLVGVWDMFPLLQSGAGGLQVEGEAVVPTSGFPLREVLQAPLGSGSLHGAAAALSEAERDDLIAYLLTL